MKKITFLFLFSVILTFSSIDSFAQTIEITPSYGYQFGSKLYYGPNYIKFEDGDQYGLTVGFETYDDVMVEVSYFHHGTEITILDRYYSPSTQRLADLSADWVMVGGTKYFETGNLRPFLGGSAGLVFVSPKNENRELFNGSLGSSTKFAFAFKGGVNIMLTDMIGINLQGNLMFPVQWGGAYVGVGTGGVSTGLGVRSISIIGGFSGGLVFRIN
jgi:hypothetical protein